MMQRPWFVRDNQYGGKHYLGPMEYKPNTWQGFLIAVGFMMLTLVFLYYTDRLFVNVGLGQGPE